MRSILSFLFIILLFSHNTFSQTVLKGKVISDGSNLGEIYITNLSTDTKTIADNSGLFSIVAKPNQVLVFSGIKINRKGFALKPSDFSNNLFTVSLSLKTNQLEEVMVKNYPNINAVSLGIISKNVKSYTPAERKLMAESSGIGISQLINAINGRTKELQKNVVIEKKEILLDKLSTLFDDDFYTKTLKIDSLYIKGFQLFAIDDKNVEASLKKTDTKVLGFLLNELSLKYNDLLLHDKK